ncbi:MAG: SH3 domain-containing protein [Candidatus Omnitrophota bacterium]
MKTRILTLSFFFLLWCCVLHGQEQFPFLGEITAKKVNVRAGQNENFEKINTLPAGEEVVVVDKSYSWYKIKLPLGSDAYVHSSYIKLLSNDIGEVRGNRVNIRAGAGPNFSVLGQLRKGTKLRLEGKEQEWFKIEPLEGIYGWVSDQFVSFKNKEIPAARVVSAPIKNIYRLKKIAETQDQGAGGPESGPESPAAALEIKPVVVSGILVPAEEHLSFQGIYHKLIVNEQSVYYLLGPKNVMDRFAQSKVNIEGRIRTTSAAVSPSPVIIISKITFQL